MTGWEVLTGKKLKFLVPLARRFFLFLACCPKEKNRLFTPVYRRLGVFFVLSVPRVTVTRAIQNPSRNKN